MKLDFAFVAGGFERNALNLVNAFGVGLALLPVQGFPCRIDRLFYVANVRYERRDFGGEHSLTLEVAGPDGALLVPENRPVLRPERDEMFPNAPHTYTHVFELVMIEVQTPGDITFTLSVDGARAKVSTLRVLVQPAASRAAAGESRP